MEREETSDKKKGRKRSLRTIVDLVRSDICEPINPPTINGDEYLPTILDDYSYCMVIKF